MSQQISPTNVTQLVFVRFIDEIQEFFFCCKELPEMSKGKDVFNVSWTFPGRTVLASVLMVPCQWLAPREQENPDIVSTHYFLYREVLISKSLEGKLKKVFDDVIKMINFIKQRPVHSKMFKKLCESLDKEHVNLLLYTEIQWLSRGRVLNRVFQLNELQIYFEQNDKPNFSKCFEHKKWLQSLAYLADIFDHIYLLNKKLQSSNKNILTSSDKILRFKKG
ncbi:Zinc finger BED domain-containing protein 5 [Trichinella sp. T9]|nr:Zinc finger BED domain-containing protein 5 [Trichinella sp. T9]KRX52525.1 Zinc finger BED domain-containing protein 5 [Trichinella sp. T9]